MENIESHFHHTLIIGLVAIFVIIPLGGWLYLAINDISLLEAVFT